MHSFASRLISRPFRNLALANKSKTYNFFSNMTQPAATVEFEEVRKGLEDKYVIYMDVRNRSELETDGKVVGSINLPLPEIIEAFSNDDQEFERKYGFAKLDKSAGSKIVVACLGGKRAAAAAEQLQQIGFEGVRVYSGSFSDWRAKEGPISKP